MIIIIGVWGAYVSRVHSRVSYLGDDFLLFMEVNWHCKHGSFWQSLCTAVKSVLSEELCISWEMHEFFCTACTHPKVYFQVWREVWIHHVLVGEVNF